MTPACLKGRKETERGKEREESKKDGVGEGNEKFKTSKHCLKQGLLV